MSKTLGNLKTSTATRLGDSTNTVWSAAELGSYAQEGYNALVRETGCLWKKANPAGLVPAAGTQTYTLPTDLELVERLTYLNRRLFPITAAEAVTNYGGMYQTVQGQLVAYVMDGDGIGVLRYVRVPSAAGTSTDISLEYQYRGATLSADGTALEIPDRYAKYLVWFMLWKAFERDGQGQDLALAEHYRRRYRDGIDRMKRRRSQARAARTATFSGERMGAQLPLPRLPWQYGVPAGRPRY